MLTYYVDELFELIFFKKNNTQNLIWITVVFLMSKFHDFVYLQPKMCKIDSESICSTTMQLEDYCNVGQIIKSILTLNNMIQKAIQGIQKHLENWRKYQLLWKQDRVAIINKLISKAPPTLFFERKLEKYMRVSKFKFIYC